MRVALVNLTNVDISWGSAKYLRRMVPLLSAHPQITSLEVYLPPTIVDGFDLAVPVHSWPRSDRNLGFPQLKASLRRAAPDVVFIPNARYVRCGAPVVCMVRNMEPLVAPVGDNPLHVAAANVARALVARRSCRLSDRVIAVSEFVRDRIVSGWQVDSGKVDVVYHGVDAVSLIAVARPPELAGVEPGEFLFTAGIIRPYRGLEDLIEAVALLASRGVRTKLAIAGRLDRYSQPYYERMKQLADSRGVAEQVFWVGQLDAAAMSWAYANCRCFLMSTRVEACPNIALEALSHGCTSVVATARPLPEFFGSAAQYYATADYVGLANLLERLLLESREIQRSWQEAARQRAVRFAWSNTLDRTINALDAAVASQAVSA